MARFNMFYYRCFYLLGIIFICNVNFLFGQGNCLIYPEDSGERKACELCYQAAEHKQGSHASQLLFDEAIKVGPKYAYAYYQKSVPFFKRGLFAEGVSLINKAIELEPQNYLFYRAYWYFYNRSYDFCIKDLEELYTVHKVPYVTTPGGELEMRILLAMGHAQTGNVSKGISWMLNLMDRYKKQPNLKGLFDHFCLGVLYFKNNQFDLAKSEFEKQLIVDDDFADTYYYLGLINAKNNKTLAKEYFSQALKKMNKEDGGYSVNIFTEFNTHKEDVRKMLSD